MNLLTREVIPAPGGMGGTEGRRPSKFWHKLSKLAAIEVTPKVAGGVSDGHRRTFWRWLRRLDWLRLARVGGLVCAPVCLLGGGLWYYVSFDAFQAERFGRRALRRFDARDFRRAAFLARKAFQLNPDCQSASLAMGRLSERAGLPSALGWYQRAYRSEPSWDSRLALARVALRYQQPPYPLARQMLAEMEQTGRRDADYHWVAADLAVGLGNLADAEAHCREALRYDPKNAPVELRLALLQLRSKEGTNVAAARKTLENLTANPSMRVPASRALLSQGVETRNEVEVQRYAQSLLQDARARARDRLAALTSLQRLNSPQFGASLVEAQMASTNRPASVGLLAAWMAYHGLAKEALEWVSRQPAAFQGAPEVIYAVMDCYAVRKDWGGLVSLLREQNWRRANFLRFAFLAKALKQLNDPSAKAEWDKAVALAAPQSDGLRVLHRAVSLWGWPTEAEECLRVARETVPAEKWPIQYLTEAYLKRGQSRELHQLYSAVLAKDTSDLAAKNNLAMLSLLLATNLTSAHQLAREAYQANQAEADYAATHAFSLWVLGKTNEALAVFGRLAPVALEDPNVAAYYGALLASSGQKEKARAYLVKVDPTRLLPEEKALLARAQRAR